jgi:basic amino acid/polyamine antiporter, APA family
VSTADERIAGPRLQQSTYARKATGLVREVRLFDMMAYSASTAVATGLALAIAIFFVYTAFPGANLTVDFLITIALSPFIWVTFALLAAAMPRTGGDYVFGSRILHPVIGLGSILNNYVGTILSVGFGGLVVVTVGLAPALGVIGYVSGNRWWIEAAHTVSRHGWNVVIGAAMIVVLTILSIVGTRVLTRVMAWAFVVTLAGTVIATLILLFTSPGTFISKINHFAQPFTHHPDAYHDTIAAGTKAGLHYPSRVGHSARSTFGALYPIMAFSVATFYGAYLAGEMKGAGKRRRQLTSIATSGFLQLLFTFVCYLIFLHTAGTNFVIAATSGSFPVGISPFYSFFASIAGGGALLTALLALSFALGPITNAYGNLVMVQRVPFALAFDGVIPGSLAKVSKRTHTPIAAFVLTAVLCIAATAWAVFTTSFVTVLTYVSLLTTTSLLISGIAAMAMPWRRPELYRDSPADWKVAGVPMLPVMGAGCTAVAVMFFVIVVMFHTNLGIPKAWVPFAIILGLFALGAVLYYGARAVQRGRGVDIELAYKAIPAE